MVPRDAPPTGSLFSAPCFVRGNSGHGLG